MRKLNEEEREITPELLLELSRALREKSKELTDIVLNLSRIRNDLRKILEMNGFITKLRATSENIVGYAIDSSFAEALPLVAGDFFLVTGGYVRYPRSDGGKKRNAGLIVRVKFQSSQIQSHRVISAYAHMVEREIALKLLENMDDFNVIFIDGPIIPFYLTFIPEEKLYPEESELISITDKLVEACRERKLSIIGIVKRVRSRFLISAIKNLVSKSLYEQLSIVANDKSLGSLILERGEAIKLGSIKQKGHILKALMMDNENKNVQDFIASHKWFSEQFFSVIKPRKSKQIVMAEVLDFANIGIDEILAWINAHATHTGCPQILDQVDGLVKVTSSLLEIARRLLTRILADNLRRTGEFKDFEILEILMEYADLQKKFAPRMG
ncbi:MAG: DNA double-strand break repair nuclease NurA [Candidatus Njordarchaeales archaeon]